MSGRMQAHLGAIDVQHRAEVQRLEPSGAIGAIAHLHDGNGVRRRQHRPMPRSGMVSMAVSDDGARPRNVRIDPGIDGRHIEIAVEDRRGHGSLSTLPEPVRFTQAAGSSGQILPPAAMMPGPMPRNATETGRANMADSLHVRWHHPC
ncbi:hypothetical protein D3C87_1330340 [compost metagenome]